MTPRAVGHPRPGLTGLGEEEEGCTVHIHSTSTVYTVAAGHISSRGAVRPAVARRGARGEEAEESGGAGDGTKS